MTRIANFQDTSEKLLYDDLLIVDNSSKSKSNKITYSNLVVDLKSKLDNINIIPSANIKFNTTTQILELFNTTDLVPVRKDGLILAFKLPKGLPLLPTNLRVATNPSYTLDTFGMQVYNGYYYDNYGYTGLDQGSLTTIGLNYLVWDSTLARWKLYKQNIKSSKILHFNMKASDVVANQDPNVGFVFWDTEVPFDTTAYPVLSKAFNGGIIPRQNNATLAGRGSNTPINVTSEGQMGVDTKLGTFGIDACWLEKNISSGNGGNYIQYYPNPTGGVGYTRYERTGEIFDYTYISSNYDNHYYDKYNKYSINQNLFDFTKLTKTGNETLTRRFGITMAIGL